MKNRLFGALVTAAFAGLLTMVFVSCPRVEDVRPQIFTITKGTHANGDFTINPGTAVAGTTVALAVMPNTGYEFSAWNIAGATVNPVRQGDAAIWTFAMPAADITVNAVFQATLPGNGDQPPDNGGNENGNGENGDDNGDQPPDNGGNENGNDENGGDNGGQPPVTPGELGPVVFIDAEGWRETLFVTW
ncbi:MAG: hypothetical protein FWD88_07870, partial [Treponema sp.]|nr:hypothetical protein [Treponema sp.]